MSDPPRQTLDPLGAARVEAAQRAGAGMVIRTPLLSSATISERCGSSVLLKAENLQRTGSFKLRGALAKLATLPPRSRVVTGSAGNHAQAVAYAARALGHRCDVFMPRTAAIAKVDATRGLGAAVHLTDGTVDDAIDAARRAAREGGAAVVHPFDDLDTIAGQATIGLELLSEVPDLRRIIVPIGGGGLACGIAIAVKKQRPDVRVVGVRVQLQDPGAAHATAWTGSSIADGIAVKSPGSITGPLLDAWVDEVITVSEDVIAEAMFLLLERGKVVVEGAGAASVAALLDGRAAAQERGVTVAILSGGNVDATVLAAVTRLHETSAGRRLVVFTRVGDSPGALAALLTKVAAEGANLVDIQHLREGVTLHPRETGVQIVLETRDAAHADVLLRNIAAAGYELVEAHPRVFDGADRSAAGQTERAEPDRSTAAPRRADS